MKLTDSSIPESLMLDNHIMYDANNILDNGYGTYDYSLHVVYDTRTTMCWGMSIRFNKDMSLGLSNALTKSNILSEINYDSYSALRHLPFTTTIKLNRKMKSQNTKALLNT